MNSQLVLRNFFLSLTTTNFDEIFYDGNTGKSIPFKNVFPPGKYAVVGNSPISLEHKNGLNINQADFVVRFNNFQLSNYEYYVGTKTNMWITGGGNQAPNCTPIVSDNASMKKILLMNANKPFKDKQLKIIEKYTSENLSSFVIFHNDALLSKFTTLLQGTPTTGFVILLLLSAKYKNIDTYGFSFGTYKKRYHYYQDSVAQDYGHRWGKELEIFKLIIQKKLLNNKDVLKSKVHNSSRTFYERNMPKHIKRLHKQRTYKNKPAIRNPAPQMKAPVHNTAFKPAFKPLPSQNTNPIDFSYKANARQNTVVDDTNNKLMEISKMLNNI